MLVILTTEEGEVQAGLCHPGLRLKGTVYSKRVQCIWISLAMGFKCTESIQVVIQNLVKIADVII